MYQGRHCTREDYALLVDETDEIIELLHTGGDDLISELESYFDLIAEFDEDIANKMRFHLSKDDLDVSKTIEIINRYIGELSQNVIVDINEHN